MELIPLKDARSEPICKVCGQTEADHQPTGARLHPFEAEEPPPGPEKPEETPPAEGLDKAGGIN